MEQELKRDELGGMKIPEKGNSRKDKGQPRHVDNYRVAASLLIAALSRAAGAPCMQASSLSMKKTSC